MYFSHDGDARRDVKIKRLRRKLGPEGYGLFWMILEEMSEADDLQLDADFATLAWDFHADAETVQSVVCDFGLFEFDDDGLKFFSPSLNRRREMAESRSNRLRDRCRSAAQARWRQPNAFRSSDPTDSAPTDSDPTDSAPTDSAPTDSAPTDSAPTDSAPTDSDPIDSDPIDLNPSNNPTIQNRSDDQNHSFDQNNPNDQNCAISQGGPNYQEKSSVLAKNISDSYRNISFMQSYANAMRTNANAMRTDANINRKENKNKKKNKKGERGKGKGSSLNSGEIIWLTPETAREIEASPFSSDVKAKLRDFVRSWNKDPTRTPLNDVSIRRHFQTLWKLSPDPAEQQELIDLAISKGWKGFYAKYSAETRIQPPRFEIPFADVVQSEFQSLRFNDGSREFD